MKSVEKRPFVLTIAGFDPSGGAGLTADIKTFEVLKVYGLAVCTANTVQDDTEFQSCHWTDIDVMKNQIDILFKRFTIDVVKIGIFENWSVLNQLLDIVLVKNSKIKIILDPVLSSSSNFSFHNNMIEFDEVLGRVYLLTPNFNEIQTLYPEKTIEATVKLISNSTNILLKGGHRKDSVGQDELFLTDGTHIIFEPFNKNCFEKHGSGCVLSSAIAGYLALGSCLEEACRKGKQYIETFLTSNESLLGYHQRY
ncbi:hydroxymethylpyrimidine/phosphomethylpyrimidine kinase [Aquimarina intermedia]|uniref:hydroxymethylpyrimidine kinase n=1 Tax=Aquimarina intermedia TaxID=350814 RepID=A0A5S5CGJ4_9FLAO|nr:hydroxymethylpyrimidine/phosphomethylpyrimidine kinase [Aquimarina intermedia]TYP77133.1 hydroxymethylpyrimidine/phosphomethylpyrimidine kinase [Aquimarina intermedia]